MEDKASILKELWPKIYSCRRCEEDGLIKEARPIFSPVFPTKVMLIGQAPGITEARLGKPFAGPAGRKLFSWLKRIGLEESHFRQNFYMASVTRCWPGKNPGGTGDRSPGKKEIANCFPYLLEELELVNPKVVILVGGIALRQFFPQLTLVQAVGSVIPDNGRFFFTLPHPSGASRWLNSLQNKERLDQALETLRDLLLKELIL